MSILIWRLEFISESGMTIHLRSTVTSTTLHDDTQVMDSIVFTFIRSSELRVLPLVSSLYIDPVRGGLNGTIISCGEGRGDDPEILLIQQFTSLETILVG